MTTKTISLSIMKVLEGSAVDDSMPPGWLNTFVERAKARFTAEEWANARVRGGADLRIEGPHKLTPMEALQDELDAERALTNGVRALRHPDGTLVKDVDERLRALGF